MFFKTKDSFCAALSAKFVGKFTRDQENPGLPEVDKPISPWLASVSGIDISCPRLKHG
jgi:hypothetical protein